MTVPEAAPAITPDMLLRGYCLGVFPMAERRDSDELLWFDPPERGILPLDGFHLPRRLRRTVLGDRFQVTTDQAFPAVIAQCAAPRPEADDTWINPEIVTLYSALFARGYVHSMECWQDGVLVGGLYGVAIGAAFFGESMFSRRTDASKVALVHLVARLRLAGYALLDTQFVTTHLTQFGATAIPRARYRRLLAKAIAAPVAWPDDPDPAALRAEIQAFGPGG